MASRPEISGFLYGASINSALLQNLPVPERRSYLVPSIKRKLCDQDRPVVGCCPQSLRIPLPRWNHQKGSCQNCFLRGKQPGLEVLLIAQMAIAAG